MKNLRLQCAPTLIWLNAEKNMESLKYKNLINNFALKIKKVKYMIGQNGRNIRIKEGRRNLNSC